MKAALLLAGLLVALGLHAQKYSYHDYVTTSCSADGLHVDADLIGGFAADAPYVRGHPYYLWVRIAAMPELAGEPLELASIRLKPIPPGQPPLTIQSIQGENTVGAAVAFVQRGLDMPYVDYELAAEIVSPRRHIPLACRLVREDTAEWRLPFWDRLLSV